MNFFRTLFEHLAAFGRKKRSTVRDIMKMRKINIIIQHKKSHDQSRFAWATPDMKQAASKAQGAGKAAAKSEEQGQGGAAQGEAKADNEKEKQSKDVKKRAGLIRGRIKRSKRRARDRW